MSSIERIFREERLRLIYQIIKDKKKVFVPDLAQQFNISESSIRLDLAELESRNLITRTHGGAILHNPLSSDIIINLDVINNRVTQMQQEKDAIGCKTASLIEDGDTIMIDGGSTTKMIAKYLTNKRNLTIITNSIILIPELISNPNINLYVLGGLANKEHWDMVGDITNNSVKQFHPKKTILGIDGITLENGLTAVLLSVPSISSVKIKMIEAGDQIIIVSDHTKIGRMCLMHVAPLEAMDILVTDSGADEKYIEKIRQRGPSVIIADK